MRASKRKARRADRDLVRIYRPTWTIHDRSTGTVQRGEAASWWIDYRDSGRRVRRSLGTPNRTDAERLASAVRERLRLVAAGLIGPDDEVRSLPLWRHLRGFLGTLRARGDVAAHVRDVRRCLYKALRATHPRPWRPGRMPELDVAPFAAYLVEVARRGLSVRSVNRRVAALRAFGRWLVETRRAAFNPFAGLRPANVETDRRRVRRALTPDETARLLKAARTRPIREATVAARLERRRRAAGRPPRRTAAEVTPAAAARLRAAGEARALVYALALGTGLRRGELVRLRWLDLVLEDPERAEVVVPAASAKARREQRVPLRRDLALRLADERARRAAEPATAPVLAGAVPDAQTFARDLLAAGIARRRLGPAGRPVRDRTGRWVPDLMDEQGRVVDFHALRTTFVSRLAASGVHPRVAQALARHSTVELTMRAYTDLSVLDLRGAVESSGEALPLPSPCLDRGNPGPLEASQGPTEGAATGAARGRPIPRNRARTAPNRAISGDGGRGGIRTPEGSATRFTVWGPHPRNRTPATGYVGGWLVWLDSGPVRPRGGGRAARQHGRRATARRPRARGARGGGARAPGAGAGRPSSPRPAAQGRAVTRHAAGRGPRAAPSPHAVRSRHEGTQVRSAAPVLPRSARGGGRRAHRRRSRGPRRAPLHRGVPPRVAPQARGAGSRPPQDLRSRAAAHRPLRGGRRRGGPDGAPAGMGFDRRPRRLGMPCCPRDVGRGRERHGGR